MSDNRCCDITPHRFARGAASDQVSTSRTTGWGDAKFLVSYQEFLRRHNFGLIAGVKLPTGDYAGQTEDGLTVGHPVRFKSGLMLGEALDTSLQASTGSTDLVVGAAASRISSSIAL